MAHPADGDDLHREGVFVVVGRAVLVVGHQLLVTAVLGGHHALHEADELQRVRPVIEEEVHALRAGETLLLDRDSIHRKGATGWQHAADLRPKFGHQTLLGHASCLRVALSSRWRKGTMDEHKRSLQTCEGAKGI